MIPPRKPFNSYKWRWATLTPTEGLNEPPIYLGVLRVLKDNEGGSPNSDAVTGGLARVEAEVAAHVNTEVRLVRSGERNLLRNSQQYWKALGLLKSTRGIDLTPFGERVADGSITRDEFAATVVKTLELPNRRIESITEVGKWDAVRLRIRPLQLILDVMQALGERDGMRGAYVTPAELIKILIPLAGCNSPIEEYVSCLRAWRTGRLDLSSWPDCAPEANDWRMAREFLLFLGHYLFCRRSAAATNYEDKFILNVADVGDLEALSRLRIEPSESKIDVADELRQSGSLTFIDRQRVLRTAFERPTQGRFRRNVITAYKISCFLTGERIPEVLEAAHIIPVEYRGTDEAANGICLRSDIHALFDSGHLRLRPTGEVIVSDVVKASRNYTILPRRVLFPRFVSAACVEWRWNYQ